MAARKKGHAPNLLDATKKVYEVLEPLDPGIQQRVLSSVLSLLGADASRLSTRDGTNLVGQTALAGGETQEKPSRPMSPVELVQQKQPSTNAQRIAVFAYFREKFEGNARFSRSDLKAYFAKARVAAPQNFDRDFGAAVSQGYIYEDGSESYLTSKGLEAVEAGFGGKAQPRGVSVAAAKRQKPKQRA